MKAPFFARYSLVVLMAMAFLVPFMFMGTRQALRSNKNDVKSWLPSQCEETENFKWYRERFESDMFVLVSWEGCTLDDPALPLLAKKLLPPAEAFPGPAAAPIQFFKSVITGRQLVDDLVEKQGLSHEEAIERLKGFVIGPDGKQTCLVLSVCQESEERWDALRDKLQLLVEHARIGRDRDARQRARAGQPEVPPRGGRADRARWPRRNVRFREVRSTWAGRRSTTWRSTRRASDRFCVWRAFPRSSACSCRGGACGAGR